MTDKISAALKTNKVSERANNYSWDCLHTYTYTHEMRNAAFKDTRKTKVAALQPRRDVNWTSCLSCVSFPYRVNTYELGSSRRIKTHYMNKI